MLKTDYFINQVTCKYQFSGKIRGINSSMTTSEGHSLQCSTLQNPTFFPSGSREDTKFIITPLFSRKCRKLNIVKKNWYNINRLVVIKNQLPPPSHPCTSKSNPHYCLFSYFQKEITSTINTANLYIMIEKKINTAIFSHQQLHPVASVANLSKESCYYSTTLILFFEAAALHHLLFITIDKLIVNMLANRYFYRTVKFQLKKNVNEGDPNELNPVKACTFGTADSTEEAART